MGKFSNFSFPLPGRKAQNERESNSRSGSAAGSIGGSSAPLVSKAERLLGTPGLGMATSNARSSTARGPSALSKYDSASSQVSISMSEDSYSSKSSDFTSITNDDFPKDQRPHRTHTQASSEILGESYGGAGNQPASAMTSTNRDLNYQASSSTLRSYYDPKSSPLLISQQTSASAVRDMALRKGYPPVGEPMGLPSNMGNPSSLRYDEEPQSYGANHPGKSPGRLDLSNLFPKPMKPSNSNLLSPNKFVSSPSQLSLASDYTPRVHGSSPLVDPADRLRKANAIGRSDSRLSVMSSNSQGFRQERSVTGTSKMKIWKPAGGIQHWFDGLEEESEEDEGDHNNGTSVASPPKPGSGAAQSVSSPRYVLENAPKRKSSLGRVLSPSGVSEQELYTPKPWPKDPPPRPMRSPIKESELRSPIKESELRSPGLSFVQTPRNFVAPSPETTILRSPPGSSYAQGLGSPVSPLSPRNFSLRSPTSQHTQETLTPTLPKKEVDLQDSSMLSMSSSEDEVEEKTRRRPIRDSVATDHDGEIIIGKAHAYEIKPRPTNKKDPSPRVSRASSTMSAHTASTSAATIDVMLSSVPHIPNIPASKQDWETRNSHIRQPSAILEDQVKTVRSPSSAHFTDGPASPTSIRSTRTNMTTKSEPAPAHKESHRLMEVTEEEEALLELMRRKRAAMAKQSFAQGFETALLQEQLHTQLQPKKGHTDGLPSTPLSPNFSGNEKSRDELLSALPTPLMIRPKTATPTKSLADESDLERRKSPLEGVKQSETSSYADSTNDNASVPYSSRPTSPGDPFPLFDSSTPTTTSVASPTTGSHASPLPSPETPGFTNEEVDVAVKVADSEPSYSGDDARSNASPTAYESMIMHPTNVREANKRQSDVTISAGRRRRTASSGHNILINPSAYPQEEDDIMSPKLDRVEQLISPTLPRNHYRDTIDTIDTIDDDTLGELSPMRETRSDNSWSGPRLQLSNSSLGSTYSNSNSTFNGIGGTEFPQTPTTPGGMPPTPTTPGGHKQGPRSIRSSRSIRSNYSTYSTRSTGSRRPPFAPGVPGQQNRQSVVSTADSNYSVSDDILAAWNSLGGGSQFIGAGKY